MPNFREQLATLQRIKKQRGAPVTRNELAGLAEADASLAHSENVTDRQLGLQEESLATQEEQFDVTKEQQASQFAEELAFSKQQADLNRKAAEKAAESEKRIGGVTAGASAGYLAASAFPAAFKSFGGEIGGAAGGAVLGFLASSTFLCTEIKEKIGLDEQVQAALGRIRKYTKENHRAWWNFYQDVGNDLVDSINESQGNDFWNSLKINMVLPVVEMVDLKQAFSFYKLYTLSLIFLFGDDEMKMKATDLEVATNG